MRFASILSCVALVVALAACSSEESEERAGKGATGGKGGVSSGGGGSSAGGTSSGGGAGAAAGSGGDAGSSAGGSAGAGGANAGGNSGSGGGAGSSSSAAAWIETHFAGAPLVSGNFTKRTTVETPALVKDASGCCAKYAFDVHEDAAPDDPRVGFVNVTIKDLVSSDAYGGGIQSASAPGLVLFLANVQVEPNWPNWVDYSTTNKDGLVLDGSAAIYAEDLTIKNWNADGAIDNKAPISQFVRLKFEGKGNRGMRYWGDGPHYLVDSQLDNAGGLGEGSVLWFSDCAAAVVKIFGSTFNGAATVPSNLVSCDNGSAPKLEYLTVDPRTTGEMHAMFKP